MINIDIEDSTVIERTGKSSGKVYYQQIAYAWTIDRDGPVRHPEKIYIFVQLQNGKPVGRPKGRYTVDPSSLRVKNGQLELGFLNLVPVAK